MLAALTVAVAVLWTPRVAETVFVMVEFKIAVTKQRQAEEV